MEETVIIMPFTSYDEAQRTSPLALWRYAHEYLCASRNLCDQIRITCTESQVPYHVAAQGIEFALKAFLRARGESMDVLRTELGHSLLGALERSEARGLAPMPPACRSAISELAPFHQNEQFVYRRMPHDAFSDVRPLVDAGVWILDRIAPDVVDHFVVHLASNDSPPAPEFVRRLRAALSATSPGAQAGSDKTLNG
jgi:hypothetical protein